MAILGQLMLIDMLLMVTAIWLSLFKPRWCRFVAVLLFALFVAVSVIEMVVFFTLYHGQLTTDN